MGAGYLDHLIVERKYAEAASLCPKLLRGSASAWERFEQISISYLLSVCFLVIVYISDIVCSLVRWVFHFAQLRQLPVLVPYMPTDNPRLKDTVYEVCIYQLLCTNSSHFFRVTIPPCKELMEDNMIEIWNIFNLIFFHSYQIFFETVWRKNYFVFMMQVALVALATNPSYHKELLSTVKSWPRSVYSALPVISAIEPQLNTSSMTDALKEVSIVSQVKLEIY